MKPRLTFTFTLLAVLLVGLSLHRLTSVPAPVSTERIEESAPVETIFATVQFTGMLTDLELEQSDRDLMTRPYMVLETDDGAGGTVQLVLYGGSITRSIGYVAFQNKDIFQPGTDSYEFIWSILEYAYPELYEQEYQDK